MATASKAWDFQVDDRINHIAEGLGGAPEFSEKEVPGLKTLLDDYIDPSVDVDKVDFARRLLRVFKDSETDNTYQDLLQKYTETERQQIEGFVDGKDPADVSDDFVLGPSLGCREELAKLQEAKSVVYVGASGITHVKGDAGSTDHPEHSWFHATVKRLASFFGIHKGELEEAGVLVYHNAEFQNWGRTVENTPSFTCIPKSVHEIQVIVKFAKEHKLSVRCSGFRHSWAPIFARNGHILISMLNLQEATKLPNLTALPLGESSPTELETIEIVSGATRIPGHTLVRVGAGCINERLRRWCVSNNRVTLPFNIIMVEITAGGANAPICHGAGRRNGRQDSTLSDLVRKIEYVDANGELRTVDKPEHLLAAGGCFGLMGVVTHLTLEFAPMTYAELKPVKMPVVRAVPPPADLPQERIPPALLAYWKDLSPEEKQSYQDEFERHANDDYYSEWFWFPYSDYAWVNCWNDTTEPKSKVVSFPDNTHIWLSFLGTFAMNVLQNTTLLTKLVECVGLSEAAVTLISRAAMYQLPDMEVTTYLTDALHFQRAIQNVRVRDMEVEIPLVAKKGSPDKVDYAHVQRAWWDAILLVYENSETCPMRMPLEMRMMGGSEVILAPQRGNGLGTCSIEILTLHSASGVWLPFAQGVLDKWMALRDPNSGERLRCRPHWAKEWDGLRVGGQSWYERMKNVEYSHERQEFVDTLAAIGKEAGWTLDDLKERFSNELFDDLFFS